MTQWWYTNGVKQAGPVAEAALVDLIRKGQVLPGYFVWCYSLSDWVRITEVDVFAPAFPTTELITTSPPKPPQPAAIARNVQHAPAAEVHARTLAPFVAPGLAMTRAVYNSPIISQRPRLLENVFRIALVIVIVSSLLPWFTLTSSTTVGLGDLSSQVSLSTPQFRMPDGTDLPHQFRGDFSVHANPQLNSSGSYSIATQGYSVIWIDLAAIIAVVGLAFGFIGPVKLFGQNCTTIMTTVAIAVLGGCVIGIINFSSFGISGSFSNGLASSSIGSQLAIGGYVGTLAALLATVTAYLTPWTSTAEH